MAGERLALPPEYDFGTGSEGSRKIIPFAEYYSPESNEHGNESQYLDEGDHCYVSFDSCPDLKHTTDHIITEMAARDFPLSLGKYSGNDIREIGANKIRVCRSCHQRIDHWVRILRNDQGIIYGGKQKLYRMYGMLGLVEYASIYPRCKDPDAREKQHRQFIKLFEILKIRIPRQINLLSDERYNLNQDNNNRFRPERNEFEMQWDKNDLQLQVFKRADYHVNRTLDRWLAGDFEIDGVTNLAIARAA